MLNSSSFRTGADGTGPEVDFDDISGIAIRQEPKPKPADDMTRAEDRDQAARELAQWTRFPFTVVAEIRDTTDVAYLYGTEARDLVRAWYQIVAPWLG